MRLPVRQCGPPGPPVVAFGVCVCDPHDQTVKRMGHRREQKSHANAHNANHTEETKIKKEQIFRN